MVSGSLPCTLEDAAYLSALQLYIEVWNGCVVLGGGHEHSISVCIRYGLDVLCWGGGDDHSISTSVVH